MSDTTNFDLHFDFEDHTNELADGELDERDLEVINGGSSQPKPGPIEPIVEIFKRWLHTDEGSNIARHFF